MAQQHETTTDRLVSIIASIKLERRSGQLIVRRGEGSAIEEGTLRFVLGQITQATVGRRSGSDALNWVSTWKLARYIFTPGDSKGETPPPLPSTSASDGTRGRLNTPVPLTHQQQSEPMPQAAPFNQVPYVVLDFSSSIVRIEKMGFSRSHRLLYLLIDGHRSVNELAQLMGRNVTEVDNMLLNLENLGIIRMTNPPPGRA